MNMKPQTAIFVIKTSNFIFFQKNFKNGVLSNFVTFLMVMKLSFGLDIINYEDTTLLNEILNVLTLLDSF